MSFIRYPIILLKRYLLPKTLFARSILIILTPVLLLQIFVTFIFFDRHWNTVSQRLADTLAGDIAHVVRHVERYSKNESRLASYLNDASQDFGLKIYLQKQRSLEKNQDKWVSISRPYFDNSLNKYIDHEYHIQEIVLNKLIKISVQIDRDVAIFHVPLSRLFISTGYIFLLWMMLFSFALFAIAILFMRNQVRPIRRLAVAAERFGKGHDVPKFKPEGAQEVRQAALAFLLMKKRISRQINQRTSMLAGVSHDLRTPLTRMKLQLAMLDNPSNDLAALNDDVNEMGHMIDAYLDFVRTSGVDEAMELIDLRSLLLSLTVKANFVQGNIHFDTENVFPCELMASPIALRRAMSNIIDNATKYGENVWIDICFIQEDHAFHITVEDDGPSIPEEMRGDVFKPFYRVDESRNSKTGGVGLGLAIAQDIIHSHGGRIVLCDSPQSGLLVEIILPK